MIQKVLDSLVKKEQVKNILYTFLGLIDDIREGDDVEFELEQGKKGLNAVNVKVI